MNCLGLLWDAGSLFGAKHYEPPLFAEENAAPVVFVVRPRFGEFVGHEPWLPLWKLADALDEIGVPAGLVSWWGSKPLGLLDVSGRVSRLIVWLDD